LFLQASQKIAFIFNYSMSIKSLLFQIFLNCVTAVKGNLILGFQGIQIASQEKTCLRIQLFPF